MKKNRLILLVFCIGCGLIYFTAGCNCEKTNSAGLAAQTAEKPVLTQSVRAEESSVQVIAYYFHRTVRCPTCRAIEANSEKMINEIFSQQISAERVIWMDVNLDQPGGKEFEKEFEVSGSMLVIAQMTNGKCSSYKKLEDVWDIYDKPEKLRKYLTDEISQMLN